MIQVLPDRAMMNVNETLSVDVSISGLGDGSAPSVSSFDIGLGFDPLLFTLGTVTFGDQLNIFDSAFGSIQDTSATGNSVNVFEVSLDPSFVLDDFQFPSFLLFNVEFTAKSAGVGLLTLGPILVLDSGGIAPLIIEPVVFPSVEVKNPSAVPVPAAVWLFGTALIGLVGMSRRRKVA